MRVIDSHLHLDGCIEGEAFEAVDKLVAEMDSARVERGVLLHLQIQRWKRAELAKAVARHKNLIAFANVRPGEDGAIDELRRAILDEGFSGLKLHPRMQKFSVSDEKCVALVQEAGRLGVPALLDAFPDGDWLMQGEGISPIGHLARACPDTKIIAAHFGGHKVIDMMMVAKRCPNLYVDMSFSWLYYRGSTVPQDMAYAMRSMRFSKIFYGSDYPDRGMSKSLKESVALMDGFAFSAEEKGKLLFDNAEEFFSFPEFGGR